jgi:hypothetical protein
MLMPVPSPSRAWGPSQAGMPCKSAPMPLNGHPVAHSQEGVQQGAPTDRQEEERADDHEEDTKQQAKSL